MRKRVIDVLLIKAYDHGRKSDREETTEVVDLMKSIHRLSKDGHVSLGWDAELPCQHEIMTCCEPSWVWQGNTDYQPARQFGTNYALLNENPAEADGYNWDPDQRLTEFVALSRLVHPSAIGYKYCARLVLDPSEKWSIIPAEDMPLAYPTHERTFLREREWQTTAELVETWRELRTVNDKAIRRLANALWWREKAAREQYMEVRWSMLITAIESLIKVWDEKPALGSTKSFIRGMRLLADLAGEPYTDPEARRSYGIRSFHSHGHPWPIRALRTDPRWKDEPVDDDEQKWLDKTRVLYTRTEAVFDGGLRKVILDDSYRDLFLDEDRLRAHLKSMS